MKLLLIADEESPYLWDYYQPGKLAGFPKAAVVKYPSPVSVSERAKQPVKIVVSPVSST